MTTYVGHAYIMHATAEKNKIKSAYDVIKEQFEKLGKGKQFEEFAKDALTMENSELKEHPRVFKAEELFDPVDVADLVAEIKAYEENKGQPKPDAQVTEDTFASELKKPEEAIAAPAPAPALPVTNAADLVGYTNYDDWEDAMAYEERDEFKKQVKALAAENSVLKEQVKNFAVEKAKLQKSLNAQDYNTVNELAADANYIDGLGTENDKLRKQLKTIAEENATLKERVEILATENVKLQETVDDTDKAYTTNINTLEKFINENEELKKQLETIAETVRNLTLENANLKEQAKNLAQEINKFQDDQNDLVNENQGFRQQLAETARNLTNVKSQYDELKKQWKEDAKLDKEVDSKKKSILPPITPESGDLKTCLTNWLRDEVDSCIQNKMKANQRSHLHLLSLPKKFFEISWSIVIKVIKDIIGDNGYTVAMAENTIESYKMSKTCAIFEFSW